MNGNFSLQDFSDIGRSAVAKTKLSLGFSVCVISSPQFLIIYLSRQHSPAGDAPVGVVQGTQKTVAVNQILKTQTLFVSTRHLGSATCWTFSMRPTRKSRKKLWTCAYLPKRSTQLLYSRPVIPTHTLPLHQITLVAPFQSSKTSP